MRHCVTAVLVSLATAACSHGSSAPPTARVHVLPAGWAQSYDDYHYSPAIRVGDTVYVSGIPAHKGADDEAKLRWMFKQLEIHLIAAGATLGDVVELETFHVAADGDAFRAQFATLQAIHAEVFPGRYPAWTAVGTTALLAPGAIVELRAVAIIGSGHAAKIQREQ